eukprot:6193663-Pleurochrysis_carterae.AAC.1
MASSGVGRPSLLAERSRSSCEGQEGLGAARAGKHCVLGECAWPRFWTQLAPPRAALWPQTHARPVALHRYEAFGVHARACVCC